jgi:hypothetical protein
MLLLLTLIVFFWKIHVFLQFSWIGLFGKKYALLPLEIPDWQEVFPSKLTQFSRETRCLMLLLQSKMVFLERYMCFFNSAKYAYLEEIESFSHLKSLMGRQYSFQKLTPFSQGNNVLDAPPSNIDAFLSNDTCLSSNQLNSPIWNKMSISYLWKPWWTPYSFQKLTPFSQEAMC